jgi:hypothetical protein
VGAGRPDLGLSDEDIAACSNKDQLIDLVTTQHEAKAADATAAEAKTRPRARRRG